jgi:hypothetical protein
MYFLAETLGFFEEEVPGSVEITDEEYAALFAAPFIGVRIAADANGRPVLVDLPAPTAAELAVAERGWRDAALAAPCAARDRHRDEVELAIATTLTAAQFADLLGYIQQLRDWPQAEGFPLAEHRPVPPAFLATSE